MIGFIIGFGFVLLAFLFFYFFDRSENKKEDEELEKLEKEEEKRVEKLLKRDKKTVDGMATIDFSGLNLNEIKQREKEFMREWDKLSEEGQDEYIEELNDMYRKIIKLMVETERKEKEEKEKQEKQRKYQEAVEGLFQFKKEKNSIAALPIGKEYPDGVRREAERRMRHYVMDKEERRDIRQEAIDYYGENSLDTEPYLDNNLKKEIFKKIREDIQKGKVQLKNKAKAEFRGEKLPKDFYRADELDEEEKRLARAQGFKYVRSNDLDGYMRGGFYIRKENPRESNYHFCTKHLFTEIHPNMYVEEQVDGRPVDVAFYLEKFKLGIEIETGANKESYLAAKIPWLNKNFDQWIFVCPKKLEGTYDKLVDNKKSLCMTPKRAKEFIQEVLINLNEPITDR